MSEPAKEVVRPAYAELDEGCSDRPSRASMHRGRTMGKHKRLLSGARLELIPLPHQQGAYDHPAAGGLCLSNRSNPTPPR